MRIGAAEGNEERLILAAMATDTVVLGRVAAIWAPGLFRSTWAATVAGWCTQYFHQYRKAPGAALRGLFNAWADRVDDDQARHIEEWLADVSSQWEREEAVNTDYMVDLAGKHFTRVRLAALAEQIQANLDVGMVDAAQQTLDGYRGIRLGGDTAVDLFNDPLVYLDAMGEEEEDIVEYPGALGKFFRGALVRDALVSFMAPEKRGKTFWLLDLAYRAACQRRKVIVFQAGDMSQRQFMRRFMARVLYRPLRPCQYQYPTAIRYQRGAKIAECKYEMRSVKEELFWKDAWRAAKRIQERRIVSPTSHLKLSTHPNSTLSVADIETILHRHATEDNWVPDVVVIDYADILRMPGSERDYRNATNEAWKALRALSQRLHCLVVTATQADADSYGAKVIRKKNFSEDKRKIAHVTGLLGINATPEEDKAGLYRLNWIARREGNWREGTCVHVARCLEIANPAVRSVF